MIAPNEATDSNMCSVSLTIEFWVDLVKLLTVIKQSKELFFPQELVAAMLHTLLKELSESDNFEQFVDMSARIGLMIVPPVEGNEK